MTPEEQKKMVAKMDNAYEAQMPGYKKLAAIQNDLYAELRKEFGNAIVSAGVSKDDNGLFIAISLAVCLNEQQIKTIEERAIKLGARAEVTVTGPAVAYSD